MKSNHYQLLILGSGPAGCTAAIYAARANLNFALITGTEQGGQLMKTTKIANWPGEPEEVSGILLMEKMMNQLRNFNAKIVFDNIKKADLSTRPFCLQGEDAAYTCDALIIATGASPKLLGLAAEQRYMGQGVSTCAVCDGFFYKNKEVVVIGGGNTAAGEALYLAKIAKQVTIIIRRDIMRAEARLLAQIQRTPNIKLETNAVTTEILGDEAGATGLCIKNLLSAATKTIPAQGIFIAIGHQPNTDIFTGQLEMEYGYIKTGYNALTTATSVPGVFAAGDAAAQSYHQAIVAAGFGCIASLDAKDFLAALDIDDNPQATTCNHGKSS